jgi:hypothetical protein
MHRGIEMKLSSRNREISIFSSKLNYYKNENSRERERESIQKTFNKGKLGKLSDIN